MTSIPLALLLALALPAAGPEPTDDPMIRWDCDGPGRRLILEMFRPPVAHVLERERYLFSGVPNFEQCRIDGASWTLLVDLVEYDSGRCEPEPDTIVSLLRNDQLVVSKVLIGRNCANRPVLSAARVTEPEDGNAPTIELCTAPAYGSESRCFTLRVDSAQQATDNDRIAAHANQLPGP